MAYQKKGTTDKYKLRPRLPLHIACEFLDLSFTREEVDWVETSWEQGKPITDIADGIKRRDAEIAVLLIDLSYRGKIDSRPGGLMGRRAG